MKLKFVIDVCGKRVVLTADQLSVIWDTLQGCEVMENKWVGSGKGTTGSSKDYLPIIKTFEAHESLTTVAVSDDYIESVKLVQKQLEQ